MKSSWRDTYIQLLNDGPRKADSLPDEERQMQRDLVSELVDGGYATGFVVKDANGKIAGFTWIGVTVQGRLLADKLAEEKIGGSWKNRIISWGLAVGGWLSGIGSAILIWWITK